MARRDSRASDKSLAKALLALQSSGLKIASLEIDSRTGNITIKIDNEAAASDSEEKMATQALNEWLLNNGD